jgi:hypothetical protein
VNRRLALALGAATSAAAALVAPVAAPAHGLVGRADLPIPAWLFTWGAAAVLVVSFVALAVLWPRPRLQEPGFRPLPVALSRVLTSRPIEILCGAIGVALLMLTVYAGLAGSQTVTANWTPTFVYVGFWLGLVPLSVLFGDIFRALNPWRAVGRTSGWLLKSVAAPPEPLPYPRWLGYWPAVAGLGAFAWLELVSPSGDDPDTVAGATLVYSALTWIGMALYGTERWCDRGEVFSVYFGLFARMSIFERRDGRLGLRKPLSGLPTWPFAPGAVALLAVMIGTVSFDGLSAGKPFNDGVRGPLDWLREDLGLGAPQALQAVFAVSALVVVLLAAAFYWLGMSGAQTVDPKKSSVELARTFAHTLVPIVLAYVAAHYVSLLLLQGQALAYLASDPLGDGSNLLGTAGAAIDYGLLGAETFWYLQVGFVVAGHLAALVLAHDRALVVFDDAQAAVRSQYWLLAVMVGFTTLALWLLAQAREG